MLRKLEIPFELGSIISTLIILNSWISKNQNVARSECM
jgi:hypothetical protein